MKNFRKISKNNLKNVTGSGPIPMDNSVGEKSCTRCVTCKNGLRSCATDTIGNCDCAQSLAQSIC